MKPTIAANPPVPPASAGAGPRGPVIPSRPNGFQSAAAWLAFFAERLVSASLRCHWRDSSGLVRESESPPVIFCLWHNRLALSMVVHRHTRRKLAALISASKDGALLASILEKHRVRPVRGSTSRRGPQALLELAGRARAGYDVAITPDGPRGPRYVVQPGVIALAQVTGRPIIAITYNTEWKIRLKTWDGFHIPLPFARCEIVLREPLVVPREASEAQREACRLALEQSLLGSSWD